MTSKWILEHPDRFRKLAREAMRRWRAKNRKVSLERNKKYRRYRPYSSFSEKLKEQYRAKDAVKKAIQRGKLIRPKKCSRCGKGGRIEGHHPDYSKRLEVIWLCKKCHALTWRVVD